MKLRKIFAVATMALCVAGASAQVSKEDVRIYINPGHGSWGPNNRHMTTIGHNPISTADPDTTDFFESNTNLRKGLALLERLHEYGVPFDKTKNQTNDNPNRVGAALDLTQNLVMSHVKCGPYPYETVNGVSPDSGNDFNRTLSVIAAEVESNNFDMFISIHSNAATDGNTVNYLYFAYDNVWHVSGEAPTEDNKAVSDEHIALSKEMSRCGWNHRILDRHTQWSHYDYTMTKEDLAAGKGKIGWQNLGVLNHSVPGYLVEGYFHTYQPARHRYMNFDMCRLEGVDYARGVADYFGWEKEKTGDIVGVVRDRNEKFSDAVYTPKAGTYDVYKPLNGVVVKLMKGEEEVAVDTTDVNYNGLFAFRDVEPGDYTVTFSHADYKADSVWTTDKATEEVAKSLAVTVKAAVTAYPTAFLANKNWVAPTTVYVNYPDSTAGKAKYALKPSYKLYDDGTCTAMAEVLAGKTVRRTILRGGNMYVLALDAENKPNVYIFDIKNDKLVKTLGTTATVGDILPLSDIALTAEGVLVGINKCNQAYGGAENVTAYKWENGEDKLPEGEAQVWWTNNFAGNWTNGVAGESMIYDGTLADGNFIYAGTTSASSGNTRIVKAAISDGSYLGYMRNNQDGTYIATSYLGETYNMTLSPNGDDMIIFDSEKVMPFEIQLNPADAQVPTILGHMAEGTVAVAANNASYFKYAGKSVMVAPDVNAEGKVAGLKMFDITEGIANATEITNTATFAEPVEVVYAAAHGEVELTFNEITGVTTDAEINVCVVVDGKVVKYTQTAPPAVNVTPAATGTANPFAYALSSEVVENTLKVNYTLNAAATAVKVVVKNSAEEVVATADGAVEAAAHTVEISLADLADDNYTWEVEVTGAEKAQMETFFADRFYHPRGIDVDNNMESSAFGHVYITEGMSTTSSTYYPATRGGVGLFIFDPQMNGVKNEKTGNYAFMGDLTYTFISYAADLARVRVAEDGRIFVTRCNNAGDYILYAPSHDELVKNNEFTSLLAGGELDATTYNYNTADGFLAGPNVGLDVKGAGEDLVIATTSATATQFALSNCNGSRTDEYALGTAEVLPAPMNIEAASGYTIAPQVTNVEYDNQGGMWWCQYRATPSDAQPALIYVDANGEQRYFEGAGGMARGGGGIRISPDGTQIAISTSKTTFSIYDLEYLADGTPELVEKTRVTHGIGTNCYDIAWDLAGNIYICGNSGEWMKGFALPRTNNTFATKAASKYAFTIGEGPSSIEDVDAVDAPVEYYNLQGVKVVNPENGIFIKKQGNKTTKVVL